jgi:hypothetical protein
MGLFDGLKKMVGAVDPAELLVQDNDKVRERRGSGEEGRKWKRGVRGGEREERESGGRDRETAKGEEIERREEGITWVQEERDIMRSREIKGGMKCKR